MQQNMDDMLVRMYKALFTGDGRFDVSSWIKEVADSEFGPVQYKLAVDKLLDQGLVSRKMGTSIVLTSLGVNHLEGSPSPLPEEEKQRIQKRRRDILKVISEVQAQGKDGTAQFGKVMEMTRLGRNECAPHIQLAEERGSLTSPQAGFYRLTDMGEYELEALNGLYPIEAEQVAPPQPDGPVDLKSIKFF